MSLWKKKEQHDAAAPKMDFVDWIPDRPETGWKPCLTQAELPKNGRTFLLEPAVQDHRRRKIPEHRVAILGIMEKVR